MLGKESELTMPASPESLMKQAGWTADVYLGAAIESIDERFGEGYAKANPALVGHFMQAAARDFQTAIAQQGSDMDAESLREGLDAIAESLDKLADVQSTMATWIKYLGTGNAGSQMGAMEFLAVELKAGLSSVAASLDLVASSVVER